MSTQRIESGEATAIQLAVTGDLSVSGGVGNEVVVFGDDDDGDERRVELSEGILRIRVRGDARVRSPRHLHLRLDRVDGDARIRDLGAGVAVEGTHGDLRVEDVQGDVSVSSVDGDLTIHRVHGLVNCGEVGGDLTATEIFGDLSIGRVAGDLKGEHINGSVVISEPVSGDVSLSSLGGGATVANVDGDLKLSGLRQAQVGDVSGDLAIQEVANTVVVGRVGGDATFDNCEATVTCGDVGGDLTARDLRGGVTVDQVGGRAKLSTTFTPGRLYDLTASGGATIVLAGDNREASVAFDLHRTDGGPIDVRLPLQELVQEPGWIRGRLGDGQATVHVESSGSLRLLSSDREGRSEPFTEGIFEGIGEEIQSAFSAFVGGGHFDFEHRFRDNAERVRQHAEETARHAGERAEQHVREATQRAAETVERQLRRAADRAQRGAERGARGGDRRGWGSMWHGQPFGGGQPFGMWPQPPPPPTAPAPPARPRATEEERMTVLRMLSEGKIGAEDAARLLEALGA